MEKRLLWSQEIHVELTRRSIHGEGNITWAEYFLLLGACADVINSMPESIEACAAMNIEERIVSDLARLAETIHDVLPGGFREFSSYLSQAARREMLVRREAERLSSRMDRREK